MGCGLRALHIHFADSVTEINRIIWHLYGHKYGSNLMNFPRLLFAASAVYKWH